MKYAAIDIGTNAARLLIGEVSNDSDEHGIQKVSYSRIPLRLGEDVFENGLISEQKIQNFIKGMQAFRLIAEIFDVKQLRACATSAMREAENGQQVLKRILEETGVNIEIISGDEEAALIFGTFELLDFDKSIPFLVIDVGGGSTEISVFDGGKKNASRSFKVGTLRLLKEKTDQKVWNDIAEWLAINVDKDVSYQLFATGGNINKAHKMLGAKHMDAISLMEIKQLHDELDPLTLRERIHRYQLKPDRADVLVPALEIYLFILKRLQADRIQVPKIGLSDGMIYEMHRKFMPQP